MVSESPPVPHDYLNQWKEFLQKYDSSEQLFILEGSLFQNSVRFLLENNHKETIPDYFSEWQSLVTSLPTKLIYLRPDNVYTHIDWIMQHRGNDWRQKITTYYEQTPFCSSFNCRGKDCMHKFWSHYATVCESLIVQATISTHIINITTDQFSSRFEKALKYVTAG